MVAVDYIGRAHTAIHSLAKQSVKSEKYDGQWLSVLEQSPSYAAHPSSDEELTTKSELSRNS